MGLLSVIIFSILAYEGVSGFQASDFAIPKKCNVTKTFKVRRQIPYEEFTFSEFSQLDEKLSIQKKIRIEEVEVNRTIPICCDGYQTFDENGCIPTCSEGCGDRGICSSPEVCSCALGYTFDQDSQDCKPVCDPECKSGICIEPNKCTCEEGYKLSSGYWNSYECKPICNNCTQEETCVEPHVCRCKDGYLRELMDRPDDLDISQCMPVCDQECVNSNCTGPNQCSCYQNYVQVDSFTCDVRMQAVSDFAVPKNCTKTLLGIERISNYQLRWYDDKILVVNKTIPICCDGYQNYDNERCIPICAENCGIQGICSAPNVCTCNKGYEKDNDLDECKPVCEHGCLNGYCVAPNTCACNDGYRKVLDFACAPICSQDCFMGTCTAPDTCTCRKGFKLSQENKFSCKPTWHKHY